jgi:hypothetical protein
MKFAAKTKVSVKKSRSEIADILDRYGVAAYSFSTNDTQQIVQFIYRTRAIQVIVEVPAHQEFRTPSGRMKKNQDAELEQVVLQRWRLLAASIKIKLELVECGQSTIEEEFMSDLLLADGRTVGDYVMKALESGNGPRLLQSKNGSF